MLRIDRLVSRYDRIEALHDVSINVVAGEIVTLVGNNGAGKTTLLRAISGVQPIASGSVIFEGETINHMPAHVRVVRGIALKDVGFGDLWPELVWLGGVLVVLVTLASLRFSKKLA